MAHHPLLSQAAVAVNRSSRSGAKGTVYIYDLEKINLPKVVSLPHAVLCLDYTPDGLLLAAGGADGSILDPQPEPRTPRP